MNFYNMVTTWVRGAISINHPRRGPAICLKDYFPYFRRSHGTIGLSSANVIMGCAIIPEKVEHSS